MKKIEKYFVICCWFMAMGTAHKPQIHEHRQHFYIKLAPRSNSKRTILVILVCYTSILNHWLRWPSLTSIANFMYSHHIINFSPIIYNDPFHTTAWWSNFLHRFFSFHFIFLFFTKRSASACSMLPGIRWCLLIKSSMASATFSCNCSGVIFGSYSIGGPKCVRNFTGKPP